MTRPARARRPRYDAPRITPRGVHCLHCGYDLRGLPGDPTRCPECGGFTGAAEFFVRVRFRQAQIVAATKANVACGFLLALGMGAAALFPWAPVGSLGLVALVAAGWARYFARVRRFVGRAPGWVAPCLLRQSVLAAALWGALLLSIALAWAAWMLHGYASRRLPPLAAELVEVALVGATTFGGFMAFVLSVVPARRGQERLMTRLTLRAMAPSAPAP